MDLEKLFKRMALVLALSIPLNLTGCGESNNNAPLVIKKNEEEPQILFTFDDLNSLKREIWDIMSIYNLEDIYLSSEEVNRVMNAVNSNQECDNKVKNAQDIYEAVMEDSCDKNGYFLTNYKSDFNKLKEMDARVKKAFKAQLEKMIDEISFEDACKLKTMKLLIGTTGTNNLMAFDSDRTILVVDYQGFAEFYKIADSMLEEGLERWLRYGINAIRMGACDCRIQKGQVNSGINYDDTLNSLVAMAEVAGDNSGLSDYNRDIFDSNKRMEARCSAVLLLSALFKENRNIKDLITIIYDSDLGGVYDFFGVETLTDGERFYRINQTLDSLYDDGDTTTNILEKRNNIGYAYKEDLFKIAVSDLMDYVFRYQDLSLEETVYLYKFVKSIVVGNAFTDYTQEGEETIYTFDVNFSKDIQEMEKVFYDFVRRFYSLDNDVFLTARDNYVLFRNFDFSEDGVDFEKLLKKFPLLKFINDIYRPIYLDVCDFEKSMTR